MAEYGLCAHIHQHELLRSCNCFLVILYLVVDSSLNAVGFDLWRLGSKFTLLLFCASNMSVELRFMCATSYKIRFYICFLAYQRYVKGFSKPQTISYIRVVGFLRCNWGFRFSRMWRCATSWMVSDFSKDHGVFDFRTLKMKTPRSFQGRESFTQWHSITSQPTGILNIISLKLLLFIERGSTTCQTQPNLLSLTVQSTQSEHVNLCVFNLLLLTTCFGHWVGLV